MKVLSTTPEGEALVEFENLVQHTKVVGVKEPIRAVVAISEIPKLVRLGQLGQRAGQQIRSLLIQLRKAKENEQV